MKSFGKLGVLCLVILNLIFLICGGSLIFGGVMLKSNTDTVLSDYFPFLNDQLMPLLSRVGFMPGFTMTDVLEMISLVLTIIGGIVAGIAVLGCCGACCKIRSVLIMYAIIISIVCGVECFAVYYLMKLKSEVNGTVRETLLGLLTQYEGKIGGLVTMAWNAVFVMFQCCGVYKQSEVDDFAKSKWNSTRGQDVIPGYCCKSADHLSGLTMFGKPCTLMPTYENSYFTSGCYTAIEELIDEYSDIFLAVCYMVIATEVAAVLFSCCVTHHISVDTKGKELKAKGRKASN